MELQQFEDALMTSVKVSDARYMYTLGNAMLDEERNKSRGTYFSNTVQGRVRGQLGEFVFDSWLQNEGITVSYSTFRENGMDRDAPYDVIIDQHVVDVKTGAFTFSEYQNLYSTSFGLQVVCSQADKEREYPITDYVYCAIDQSRWPWKVATIGYATADEVKASKVYKYSSECYQIPISQLHPMGMLEDAIIKGVA